MQKRPEIIETTAGQVAAEHARRGIRPEDRVTITIDPEQDLLLRGRKESRARVLADDDIERMIEEARNEVQPRG